jgi:ABC-type phosphate/phosphonate transport system ATPase subunit
MLSIKEKAGFWLKNLNVEINRNELVAVIGSVASGKVRIITD